MSNRLTGGYDATRMKARVIVTLTCGCKTKTRIVPLPTARLGCTSGLAHGYTLNWTEAVVNGHVTYNRLPKQREGEK